MMGCIRVRKSKQKQTRYWMMFFPLPDRLFIRSKMNKIILKVAENAHDLSNHVVLTATCLLDQWQEEFVVHRLLKKETEMQSFPYRWCVNVTHTNICQTCQLRMINLQSIQSPIYLYLYRRNVMKLYILTFVFTGIFSWIPNVYETLLEVDNVFRLDSWKKSEIEFLHYFNRICIMKSVQQLNNLTL